MQFFRSVLSLLIFSLALDAAVVARASDMKLEAKLVWGSNEVTPDSKFRPVDAALAQDLNRIFKWKNYVEITNRVVSIPKDATKDVQMSSKCALKIKNLGSSRIEVDFVGAGKQVSKGVHPLPVGKRLTLAGDDKNDSAWFVVLKSLDPKVADARK